MFRAKHPRVDVRLLPSPSDDQVAALRDGTIALGYGYHAPESNPLIRSRVLFRDRIGVVLWKGHRLASRRTVQISDLKNERFIWSPRKDSPRLHDDVVAAFRAHGHTLRFAHEEVDGEALLTLAASGDGVSFFAESTAPLVQVGAVLKRVRDLGVLALGRSVWRVADESDPLVRSLLGITHSVHAS